MFRLLIPCLIWLSSVHCYGVHMPIPESGAEEKIGMSDPLMAKSKREYHHPCPPVYAHVPAYNPPVYVKPIAPVIIPKKEVSVQAAPAQIQYIHQPSYAAVVPKQTVTYVKPAPISVAVKPAYAPAVIQPKVVYQKPAISYAPVYQKPAISYAPVYQKPAISYAPVYQKPAISYAPIYQKPIYYAAPMYQKPMYEPMPKLYVKKIEAPVTQVVYQKPQPIAIAPVQYQPKVIQVQAPQINYVKPVIHPAPVYHPPAVVKPYCP